MVGGAWASYTSAHYKAWVRTFGVETGMCKRKGKKKQQFKTTRINMSNLVSNQIPEKKKIPM